MSALDYDNNTKIHTGNVTVSENKSSCEFINPNKLVLRKIEVDGGLIRDSSQEKCDYILHWEDRHVVYIELKGADVNKAFSQVKNTIKLTQDEFSNFSFKQCIIICSRMRIPKNDSTMTRLKREMKQLTGQAPIIKSQKHVYNVKP